MSPIEATPVGAEGTCFVMQPFDNGGPFDKRYKATFEQAIQDAGLEPYRVDSDPSSTLPIEDIQEGIKRARIGFAEITTLNPNVMFELGYAFAAGLDVVMVSEKRDSYPFDVRHRTIIEYLTDSQADWDKLKREITAKLRALLEKPSDPLPKLRDVDNSETLELSKPERFAFLGVLYAFGHEKALPIRLIQNAARNSGGSPFAAIIAVKTLIQRGLIREVPPVTFRGVQQSCYTLTEQGVAWAQANADKKTLDVLDEFFDEGEDDQAPS